ncbi:hypothetical protein JAAARDRAFT_136332 [Jaapia argillacea MUCL 33604]|uniref:RING-type domain-containing protein n=1 Tax=Jaapia argillacea MUCL 33604 TaxID=933084 RepID=A0A067PRF1_9AGAM|nr:hypothetical protein JAAARDRAFT_136332 [Jaapia argillacea MUCL 33604]
MLTLNTGSVCDVCAEEYGPHRRPHSITCGHVLCAACCDTIIEKTSPRLTPVCPFCREQFTSDSIRLIRLDFTSSGVSTPRRFPNSLEANEVFNEDLVDDRAYSFDSVQGRVATARAEARRLEDKVAKVAHKKCSVEEVHTLHEELTKWLQSEVKTDDQVSAALKSLSIPTRLKIDRKLLSHQTSSLHLSAALLRAILLNHLAHSEATKAARSLESSLRARIDDLEMSKAKLEGELTK